MYNKQYKTQQVNQAFHFGKMPFRGASVRKFGMERHKVFIGGNNIKLGQMKLTSIFTSFPISAGIKPSTIACYNSHLSNNDRHNFSVEPQFKTKDVSKCSIIA
ncbi:uncharacterized protein B0H18DRAFT_1125244 [Fomitopsis serialis]|uniref:uncharacterized protein n=1 Tax=Fomitopsis serialis TaxID=139415 RepID=UPI0020089681|nr:uncharacterized protein B0H18DRAFT_1125244 [Neoantrodia serialis]KAH9914858.1 hypothetical protein B0H18DRAFT_1125244 [Neoantrodia serialis]